MKPHRRPPQPSSSGKGTRPEGSGKIRGGNIHGGNIHDQAMDEFHSFFEKLSSLDDLKWSSEGEPQSTQSIQSKAKSAYRHATTPRLRPDPAENEGRRVAPRPKMNVVKSDSMASGKEGLANSVAHPRRSKKISSGDATRYLKLALISLILFGLGLGAGWAALSLPDRFQQKMPALARFLENGKTSGVGERYHSLARDGMRIIDRIKPLLGWGSAGKADDRPGKEKASGAGTSSRNIQGTSSSTQGAVPGYLVPLSNGKKAPLDPVRLPAFSRRNSTPSTGNGTVTGAGNGAGNTPLQSVYAPNSAPSHILQVGACSSYACVENFRKLLLGRVSSNSIQIVKQQNADGSRTIQRIRIGPLGKMDAEELKSSLIALDPQFRGAYIISTR